MAARAWNSFALSNEIRQFFDKSQLLVGYISPGTDTQVCKFLNDIGGGPDIADRVNAFAGIKRDGVSPESMIGWALILLDPQPRFGAAVGGQQPDFAAAGAGGQ